MSNHGLLTTVAYQLGPGQPVAYALEVMNYSVQTFNGMLLICPYLGHAKQG